MSRQQEREANEVLWVAELLAYRTIRGHTALTYATMYGNEEIVHLLLDHGAGLDEGESSSTSRWYVKRM